MTLISDSLVFGQTPAEDARLLTHGTSTSHSVPVYLPLYTLAPNDAAWWTEANVCRRLAQGRRRQWLNPRSMSSRNNHCANESTKLHFNCILTSTWSITKTQSTVVVRTLDGEQWNSCAQTSIVSQSPQTAHSDNNSELSSRLWCLTNA